MRKGRSRPPGCPILEIVRIQHPFQPILALAHRPLMVPDKYGLQNFQKGTDIGLAHIDRPFNEDPRGLVLRAQPDGADAIEIALGPDNELIVGNFGYIGDKLEGVRQQTLGETAEPESFPVYAPTINFLDIQKDGRPPAGDSQGIMYDGPQLCDGVVELPRRCDEK
jgi:hypothetical protein